MKYAKFLLAAAATAITGIVGAMTDGLITSPEWVNVAIMFVGSLGVLTSPNIPGAKYTKSVLAALTAVLVLLVSYIADNRLSVEEILQLVVAALGAVGIVAVPNRGDTLDQLTAGKP